MIKAKRLLRSYVLHGPLVGAIIARSEEEFLARLKELYRTSGRTLRPVAKGTGGHVPKSTLHDILSGKTLRPRDFQIRYLALACGASASEADQWVGQWERVKSGRRPVEHPGRTSANTIPGVRHELWTGADQLDAALLYLYAAGGLVKEAANSVVVVEGSSRTDISKAPETLERAGETLRQLVRDLEGVQVGVELYIPNL